ncbi:MAG: helix-turn-helix domain-containing protein [Nanoarchaeota archaeon]|nr:helix-turn-helix domain-containing protein [Nanoarchaeota archaeon]
MAENTSKPIIEAMKKKGMTLERLEAVSGISERHIMAIVENNRKKLPAAPYLRGYLMKIGKILDFDGEELWKEYAAGGEAIRQSGAYDKLPENAPPEKKGGLKIIFVGIVLLALAVFAGTRFFRADNPGIQFENLEEEITETKERTFMIRGAINQKFKLTLGEEEIVLKDGGAFEKEVILEPGFNTFIFVAKKALGKEHKFPKQIFYEEEIVKDKTEDGIPQETYAPRQAVPKVVPETPEVIQ